MNGRRNFILGVLNGVLFTVGVAFTNPTVVLPWYVSQLTQSNVLIGILPALQLGGWALPQLLFTSFLQRRRHRLRYYRRGAAVRSTTWALLTATVLFAPQRAEVVLPIMVVLLAFASLSGGFTGLAFYDVVGRIVERRQLSTFFSLRNFLGGIGALAAGFVVRQVLAAAEVNLQAVGLLYLLTWVFTTGGYLAFGNVKEPEGPPALPQRTMRQDLRHIRKILTEDPAYRAYLSIRAISMAALIATPFYVVYGAQALELPAVVVASSALALVGGTIGSNVAWGWLGARGGGWLLLVVATALSVLPPLLALGAQALAASQATVVVVGAVFLALFVALGIVTGGQEVTYSVLAIEISPASERIIYLGFTNTLVGILTLLIPVGGLLADLVSFEALFGAAAVASLIAAVLAVAALRKHAPRRRGPVEPTLAPEADGV